MTKTKKLSRRQRAVIEDLFTDELDEEGVLAKHHVSQALYSRWLADDHFAEQLELRIGQANRAGRIILARYASVAAGNLATLTECKKEEIARKACLDIITLDAVTAAHKAPIAAGQDGNAPDDAELPPEIARRILVALASGNDDG